MTVSAKTNRPLSSSEVIKVTNFQGRLADRPLYIYLPPGYRDNTRSAYPVLYMHDGQNCFEAFVADSFVGSWRADQTADRLIKASKIEPCIIVGVSNGGPARITEYLPPYIRNRFLRPPHQTSEPLAQSPRLFSGRADKTAAYYQHDVAPYIQAHYRVLADREHTATCGSSLGGLFSAYLAWEHPTFAKHHALMSPSFWLTKVSAGRQARPQAADRYETIERFRSEKIPDVRIWLDSGTRSDGGSGDDGLSLTKMAKTVLLTRGFTEGNNFHFHVASGANHHESAWADRFDKVLRFLFPPKRS